MFFTYDQAKAHNTRFVEAFIDLKVVGWKTYAKALNEYTNSFFKTQIDSATTTVENTADIMKKSLTLIK